MKFDLNTQEGLELFLADYFESFATVQAGTLNAMLQPELLSCSLEKKRLTLRFPTQDWMRNPAGDVHGGALASMLDFAMGIASRCMTGGNMTPTIDMHLTYLRAVRPGSSIITEAVCSKAGRSLCFVQGRAWCEGAPDKLCVTAEGSYYVRGKQRHQIM